MFLQTELLDCEEIHGFAVLRPYRTIFSSHAEVRYVTVNSVIKGQVTIYNKGKERVILLFSSL